MVWFRWVVLSVAFACQPKTLGGHTSPPPDGSLIVCPVTKESCSKGPETESAIFEGRTFYFCRPESRAVFVENPSRYAYN